MILNDLERQIGGLCRDVNEPKLWREREREQLNEDENETRNKFRKREREQ